MRLTCFFLTVFLFHTAAGTHAQRMRMNLNLKQSTIKNVLKEIEMKSDFTFFYNDSEIDVDRVVDIRVRNENIESILNRILPNCDYVVENKKIILVPIKASAPDKSGTSQSGQVTVTGTVTDEYGDPLPGVNINVLGTTQGIVSDLDGNYHITLSSNASLVFSFVGYTRQTIPVNGKTSINVVLKEDAKLMEEVVVVGFAKQKKSNLTGSVSSIKVDEILGDRPVTTAGNLLQGTMPGLQTTIDSGEPGGEYKFNIRGTTSINGGSPLILVDNVPFAGSIELINPEDIESVTILKDGGAAAIYGSRSAFGVILITTKSAELNQKFQVNYNNNFTFSSPSELPVKASPRAAVQAFKDMGLMSNYTGQMIDPWLELIDAYNADPSLYPSGYAMLDGTRYALKETDLLGDFFQTGFQQKHNISVQGGSSAVSYRLSFGYVDDDGVMVTKKDRFQRYNFRTFLNAKLTDWLSAQADVSYIKSDKSMPNNADYLWAVAYPSYTEMEDLEINGEVYPAGTPGNKVRLGGTNLDARANTRMTGKLIATPVKGLVLNAEFTYDDLRRTQTNYEKRIKISSPNKYEPESFGNTSTLTKRNYTTTHSTWNIYGSYTKSFNKHNLTGLLGFNQEVHDYEEIKNVGTYFISDEMPSFSLAQDQAELTSDKYSQYSLRGYFGRINYDYDNRYLLEVNGRYDGSSKFQKGHKWGFFPSVSVAWRVMQEPFMEPFLNYVPEFKIRLSYSTVGNQNIDPYKFNPSMKGTSASWVVDGNRPITLDPPLLVTDDFSWETIETYNLGLDISLLRNRLQANFDLYRRNTRNMLAIAMELPAVVGEKAPQQNVGDLRSEGFELELKWNDRIGKVDYHLGANLYNYSAKITNIYNEAGLFRNRNEAYSKDDEKRYRTGMKIGEIWGYTFDRYYTEDDFINGELKPGIPRPDGVNPNPGDILFVDYDDDGVIKQGANTVDDPGDQRIIGNSSLKWQYGISGGASWNNFSFSFLLQGVGKRDVWLANDLTLPFNYEYGTIYAHQLDYWTPTNTNAAYPRLYSTGKRDGNFNSNYRISDRYLLNGAYLRIKNLTFSYTIPDAFIKKTGLSNFRIYTTVENPFTFHHLPKGVDPTIAGVGSTGLGYPVMRAYSFGFSFTL